MSIISFNGYKNIGAMYYKNNQNQYLHMNIELTNKHSEDLEDFQPILKKYPNRINKNFLDIQYLDIKTPNCKSPIFTINESFLPIANENLPVFSKIARLIRRISQDTNPITVNNDYLYGADCKNVFCSDLNILNSQKIKKNLEDLHINSVAKQSAKKMDEIIEQEITQYFE